MFIFGGDTEMSYDEMQAKRRMAQALIGKSGTPRNVGEGINSAAKSIAGALMLRSANKEGERQRKEFQEQFKQIAPNTSGLADLAASPHASSAHRDVIAALMKGAPNFANGGMMPHTGPAVVGEMGPEVVQLPQGAQVTPLPEGFMQPPEPNEELLKQLGAGKYLQYKQMSPRERLDFLNDPANGLIQQPPSNFDPRGMIDESRFDDARQTKVADLDAFKLMQLQPEYGDAVDADVNATEGQRINFLRRMMFANAALEDPRLSKAMTRLDYDLAGNLGAIGRLYTPDEFELGKLMAEQFANANLRNESGAAIPDNEVKRSIQQYFPLPNETDQQLQAKAALRREVIRSLEQALGGDAAPVVQQIREEINELRRQADVPDGSLTGGGDLSSVSDEELMKMLQGQ